MTVTRTEVERLAKALRDGMVLTVTVDASVEDPAMLHAWRRAVEESVAGAALDYERAPKAEREALAQAIEHVLAALPASPADVEGGAWVAFATPARLELEGSTPRAIATRAEWRRGPLAGRVLAGLVARANRYGVLVNSVSAAIFRCTDHGAERLVRLHAHVPDSEPVHMGGQPRERFHPGTRGRTATEAAQLARREGHRRMMNELADHAEKLAGRTGLLVVGGEPSAAREAATMLVERCPKRVARAPELRVLAAEHEIAAAVSEAAGHLEHAREQALLARVLERAGAGGRGAVGQESVHRALEQGAVRELLVSATLLDPQRATADDAETMISRAFAEGAVVTVLTGLAAATAELQADGVAADLRFVPVAVGVAT